MALKMKLASSPSFMQSNGNDPFRRNAKGNACNEFNHGSASKVIENEEIHANFGCLEKFKYLQKTI